MNALNTPFPLDEAPLVRACLIARASGDTILCLVVHHAVCDGMSLDIILRDVSRCLAGAELGPVSKRYFADYVTWEAEVRSADRRHWLDVIGAVAPTAASDPWHDVPRYKEAAVAFELPVDTALLEDVCTEQRVTPFMVLLALYARGLARSFGRTQIRIMTDVSGRHGRTSSGATVAFPDLVGCLATRVYLQFDEASLSVGGAVLLRAARDAVTHAILHPFCPSWEMMRALEQTPYFALDSPRPLPLRIPGVEVCAVSLPSDFSSAEEAECQRGLLVGAAVNTRLTLSDYGCTGVMRFNGACLSHRKVRDFIRSISLQAELLRDLGRGKAFED